jgi:SAM-dependent methyltransferase
VALDWRQDDVDGLGAARGYGAVLSPPLHCVAASFDALPTARVFDLAVFNAAIHYATSLADVLGEAARAVVSGGSVVILDTPFYRRAEDGERMIAEKRETAMSEWGPRASELVQWPVIEYLTVERLYGASAPHRLSWRRHRARYPLWYRLRPVVAAIRGSRRPSRFDVWEAVVP